MDERAAELGRLFVAEPIVVKPVAFNFELILLGGGRAIIGMEVTEGMLVGGRGIVNGGIMDTLANTASVYAAMSAIPEGHMPRMNFSVRNLRMAKLGEILHADAEVYSENDSSIIVNFEVVNAYFPKDVKAVGQGQYHKPPKK